MKKENENDLRYELDKTKLILDAQADIVIVTDGEKLVYANRAFLNFFKADNIEEYLLKSDCICDYFINDEQNRYLKKIYPDGTSWADLILKEPDMIHKAMMVNKNGQNRIFEVKGQALQDDAIDYFQEVVTFADITTLENQALLIADMEVPILEISDNIALIPLVGILDSVKSQTLMENILLSIKDKSTKITIVDIEGIMIVDSAVAAHLIKITKATRLMGCRTILSGIAPEVAQTMVNLGINLDDIFTTSTLKDALKLANEK